MSADRGRPFNPRPIAASLVINCHRQPAAWDDHPNVPMCSYCGKENPEDDGICCDCGTKLGEESSRKTVKTRSAILLSILFFYLPQCWVLFISTGESSRLFWQKMFLVLPGFSVYMLGCLFGIRRVPNFPLPIVVAISATLTACVLFGLIMAAKRWQSRPGLFFAALIASSAFLGWFAHGLFAM
jgi:hypothetical protein